MGAAGRSIGRPNQSDLAGGESRSDIGGVISVSRPNPELKPRRADNFDLSLEYYFDGGNGLLSAGVFHKNIKDEIFREDELLNLLDEAHATHDRYVDEHPERFSTHDRLQGQAKLATLAEALAPGEVARMPIRAFLHSPLEIYWCP